MDRRILKAAFVLWASACVAAGPAAVRAAIPTYGVDIVHTYPHDPTAFTEGLFY
jgi:glutaminyl-peptide cyclotransferase